MTNTYFNDGARAMPKEPDPAKMVELRLENGALAELDRVRKREKWSDVDFIQRAIGLSVAIANNQYRLEDEDSSVVIGGDSKRKRTVKFELTEESLDTINKAAAMLSMQPVDFIERAISVFLHVAKGRYRAVKV